MYKTILELINAQKEQIKVSEHEIYELLKKKKDLDAEKEDRLIELHAKNIYEEYIVRKEYQDFTVPYTAPEYHSSRLWTLKERLQKMTGKIVQMEDVKGYGNNTSCTFRFSN
jgi:hypothetical protein